jgi:hypothetical protein
MANEAQIQVAAKLGGVASATAGRQHLLTNEHGVTSIINDAHYERMKYDAKQSKAAADQMKNYTIVEDISDEELAKLAGATPEVQNIRTSRKSEGSKAE